MKEIYPLTQAEEIISQACQKLVFRPGNFEPATFRQTGQTNCFGYTILASEALQAENVPHQVCFVNGHGTIIVPQGDQLRLSDPLAPYINQQIDNKLVLCQPRSADIKTGWLNRLRVADEASRGRKTYFDTIEKHSWLSSHKQSRYFVNSNFLGRNLLISMFEPKLGVKAIKLYGDFVIAYEKENIDTAAKSIIDMEGIFPDIDARERSMKRVNSVVRRLAVAGDFEKAQQVTDAFFGNFKISNDSRITEHRADCLRYIARHSDKKSVAKVALELYEATAANPKSFKSSIRNKIKLCQELIVG